MVNIYPFNLPLKQGGLRRGILIEKKGNWGEVSPLPGWSKETYEEALQQLQYPKKGPLFPSVAFGLESVNYPTPLKACSLPLAAFLAGSPEQILEKAQSCKAEGFSYAKVKVGHLSLKEAFEIIHFLKKDFRLRIDVNRAWPLEDSLHFFSHFSHGDFDYVEEPLREVGHLGSFPIPFALDETLFEYPVESFTHLPLFKALIFKPTLWGGTRVLKKLLQLKKPLILSGAYESGVGVFHIAALIQRLNLPIYPLGVDTYRELGADLLETPLEIQGGHLHLPEVLNLKKNI